MKISKHAYLLCILLLCTHSQLWAANIKDIRIGVKKSFTRIVFDLSEKPDIYNIKYMANPDRIVIDFIEGNIDKRAIKNTSAYTLINKISGTNIRDNGFTIEIELNKAANFKHFILNPSENTEHRLVVDITPGAHKFSAKPQTILPDPINQQSRKKSRSVTDYQSDTIKLYDNKVFSDATIEQLFNPFQGNTQLRKSYYLDGFDNRKKEKQKRPIVQSKSSNAPTFNIRGYKIKGNSLLSHEILKEAINPFTGSKKTFTAVQRALEALELSYQKSGYGMVQVYLPEQELTKGIIVLNVIEPKISTLTVQGANNFSLDNIQSSIVSLKKGQTPNTKEIAKNLLLVNENPAKKTTIQFLSSDKEGELNTVINVKDKSPTSYSFLLDNTGTKSTGEYRASVGYQNANLTNNDDVFNFQYTSSEKSEAIAAYSAGYHLPLYQMKSSLDVFVGYSEIESGVIQNLYQVSGKGIVFGARLNQILTKQNNYSHRINYGFDYKDYDVDAIQLSGGESIIPDITVKPISMTYSGQWTSPGKATGFNLQVHYNAFASEQDSVEFNNSRTSAKPNYLIVRYGIEHARAFAKTWQLRALLSGQQTFDALISGEQFGAGGANSVRGYNERDVSNDKGFQATAEIYSPNFAKAISLKGDARALVFYDTAQLSRNFAQAGDTSSSEISGFGVGIRLNRKDNLSFKLDIAIPLKATATQESGETKVHTTLRYVF